MSPARFIDWHYFDVWPKLLLIWANSILFPIYFFSIPLHLRTLFSPWRKQRIKGKPGFHLDNFFQAVSFNLISRTLGFLCRLVLIGFGILCIPLFFTAFLILFFIWPALPFVSIFLYTRRNSPTSQQVAYALEDSRGRPHYFLVSLTQSEAGRFVLTKLGLNPDGVAKTFLKNYTSLPRLSLLDPKSRHFNLMDAFKSLERDYKPFSDFLFHHKIRSEMLQEACLWRMRLDSYQKPILLLNPTAIRHIRGLGSDWAYGYTVTLDRYSRDMTRLPEPFPLLIRHEEIIQTMENVLTQTESNNILLVGEPGTGRHIVVETLANRILTGNCPKNLSHKRILLLNMHALLSDYPEIDKLKGALSEILEEAQYAGNIIICVNEFDSFISAKDEKVDLSTVFTDFARSSVGLIAITSPNAYHHTIKNKTELIGLFQKVDVPEPDQNSLIEQLEIAIIPVLENRYGIAILVSAMLSAIELSERYVTDSASPGKAIRLLDQACVSAKSNHHPVHQITDRHIEATVSSLYKIPLGSLNLDERNIFLNFEEKLHEHLIGQEAAVEAIASALRRSRLNISSHSKPVGSFLFLGPTGVGKTQTAKALASVYFKDPQAFIRLDMSQYQGDEGLKRLIGSADETINGELTSHLSDRPFSLLLLDELEKTDPKIMNLLLTLLDEGYITNGTGKRISAKNSIIIATSNVSSGYICELISRGVRGNELLSATLENVRNEKTFSPEFLNRFDQVIVFRPLTDEQIHLVARMMLSELNRRLQEKEISVDVSESLIDDLAKRGYDPQYGARSMHRIITEIVENQLAKQLLEGKLKRGQIAKISLPN